MDFLERKILEIIQTNNEINKEEILKTEDQNPNKNFNVLEKVSGMMKSLLNLLLIEFYKILYFNIITNIR